MSTIAAEQAREALRLAEGEPGRSLPLAAAAARQARAERDHATAAVAERALGIAVLHLGDLDTAVAHLRAAIALGLRARSPQLAAEARMTLAFVLNRRGRPRRALREIEAALSGLDGVQRARAQAQRAAILQQLGRLDEALSDYRAALPALRRAGDLLWVQRVLSNRGVLHTFRHAYVAAETDLQEAERLCRELDLGLSAAFVQENLGFVNARRGDVPAALHHYDLAERRYRALHAQLGSLLVDRSELLLSVRLVSEAREAAAQAVAEFERERRRIALPEARLLLARAAVLDGDPAGALEEARRAAREFARHGRPEWVWLARFSVLTARLDDGRPPRVAIGQVERTAEALAAAGWPAAALDARLLAARLALDRGRTGQGCQQLQQASRGRRRGPAALRARAWYAEALLRLAAGNRRAATVAVGAGLRILDEHRATLGATDLRAHVVGHRTELAELGLRIALHEARPRRVLAWAERGRARHLLMRPARPPDDPVLAGALAELRATVAEIDQARGAGRGAARLVQRQVELEEAIRDHCRRQVGEAALPAQGAVPLDSLGHALGDAALVEFVQLDGVLHAVTMARGRVRLHQLGPVAPLRDLVERLPFALHRLARHHAAAASRSAAATVLQDAAERADAILLRPLVRELGDGPLVLVPTGPLQSLPWSILPSCAGRPVSVSPSAALWHAASRPGATAGRVVAGGRAAAARRVVVAAGPGLPGARVEAEQVAAVHGTTPLLGQAATVEAVAAALNRASLAHLAAHGRVRADNPLFSSLRLSDGPLTVYDLERQERVPDTVVLAACDSGRAVVRAGDELLGLSATFLSHGTRQLVASVVPVPDAETAPLMVAFHRLLAAGRPAAAALAESQQQVAREQTTAMAASAGFVCIGAG